MIASEFIYDNIVSGLTLNCPVYLGPSAALQTSYISILDVGNQPNPAYLRDVYTIDFIGRFEKSDYALGLGDFNTIKDAILGHPNIVDADGNDWCRFIITQGPQFSNVDDLGRNVFTMLFEIVVDSSPNGSYRQSIQ